MDIVEVALQFEARLPLQDQPAFGVSMERAVDIRQGSFRPIRKAASVSQGERNARRIRAVRGADFLHDKADGARAAGRGFEDFPHLATSRAYVLVKEALVTLASPELAHGEEKSVERDHQDAEQGQRDEGFE